MGTTKAHPNKSPRWFKPKYFDRRGNRDWSFFGETCDDEGRPNKVWLYHAKRALPSKRHVKVKGEANPYDPTYETYLRRTRRSSHVGNAFGVPALFAISGMNNADFARSAIQKSPGSQAGAFTTASPV